MQVRKMSLIIPIFLIVLVYTSAQNVSETTDIPGTGFYSTEQITPTRAGGRTVGTATSSIELAEPVEQTTAFIGSTEIPTLDVAVSHFLSTSESIEFSLAVDHTIELILTSIGRISSTPSTTNEFTEVNPDRTPGIASTSVDTVHNIGYTSVISPTPTETGDDSPSSLFNQSFVVAVLIVLATALLIIIALVCTCICCACCSGGCCYAPPKYHAFSI